MGNTPSEPSLDPQFLSGSVPLIQSFSYDVTLHHTTQKPFSKYRIIRYQHVNRRDQIELKLKSCGRLHSVLINLFQPSDLLTHASIPATCRHPSVLHVRRALPDPTSDSLFLITEPCLPLQCLLQSCTTMDVLVGIRSILHGLDFVHSHLSVSHNNLRVSSIFVGPTQAHWMLGGFELALRADCMNSDVIQLLERLHDESDGAPAFAHSAAHPFSYDIYAFSRLCTRLVPDMNLDTDLFSDFLEVLRKSCLHPLPRVRLPPSQLLSHPVFRHPLILSVDFFDNYMTYADSEKNKFFRAFEEKIAQHLPMDVLCRGVLARCLESTIFLDPPSQSVINRMLHPRADTPHGSDQCVITSKNESFVSCSAFKQYLAPMILGKFRLHERQTRIILLEHFSGYVHLFELSELRDLVLPEVCLGVFDQYEPLCGLSVRALGHLSDHLGAVKALNALRQTETRLRRTNRFPTGSSPQQLWPRGRFFAEAAPKISRQQREIPASEERPSRPVLSLAQMAALSPTYEPDSNPVLLDCESGSPTPLRGSAVKLSSLTSNPVDPITSDVAKTKLMNGFSDVNNKKTDIHLETIPVTEDESNDWEESWDAETWE